MLSDELSFKLPVLTLSVEKKMLATGLQTGYNQNRYSLELIKLLGTLTITVTKIFIFN